LAAARKLSGGRQIKYFSYVAPTGFRTIHSGRKNIFSRSITWIVLELLYQLNDAYVFITLFNFAPQWEIHKNKNKKQKKNLLPTFNIFPLNDRDTRGKRDDSLASR
jgi:hypothetical protein